MFVRGTFVVQVVELVVFIVKFDVCGDLKVARSLRFDRTMRLDSVI